MTTSTHAEALRAPTGTHDVMPGESERWIALLGVFASLVEKAGFGLIHTPLFEDVRLFRRGVGTETEVVGKEMYEFEDKGGRAMALRPEGTASVVRAVIQHHPTMPFKAWYATPTFRYERPQAGRYRQHHQVGVEVLGISDPDLDVEVLELAVDYLHALGLSGFTLRLNSLGDPACRPAYLDELQCYLTAHVGELCDEHAGKIDANPLRILDCKRETCRSVSAAAPSMADALCAECAKHHDRVRAGLDAHGVAYLNDAALVRGLDYYTRTTFEITIPIEGSELTILGGGRYDGLVAALGGEDTPGIGFGSGIERVLLACDGQGAFAVAPSVPEVFIIDTTDGTIARDVVAKLRRAGIAADRGYGGRSMKSQMKSADRSGAKFALIVGSKEAAAGTITIRDLRGDGTQHEVDASTLVASLAALTTTPKDLHS